MKVMKKRIISSIIIVGVLFSFIHVVSFADSFSLRNGIMFGDSYETVKSKETMPFNEADDSVLDSGIRQVFTGKGKVAGLDDGQIMFRFTPDNKLYEMKYDYTFISSKETIEYDYETIYNGLVRKYGEPLNYSDGNISLITTIAIDGALGVVGMFNSINAAADYIDYDEWIVELGDGNNIKIEIISYYTGSIDNRKYSLNVGYKMFTDEEMEQAISDKKASTASIDDEL